MFITVTIQFAEMCLGYFDNGLAIRKSSRCKEQYKHL